MLIHWVTPGSNNIYAVRQKRICFNIKKKPFLSLLDFWLHLSSCTSADAFFSSMTPAYSDSSQKSGQWLNKKRRNCMPIHIKYTSKNPRRRRNITYLCLCFGTYVKRTPKAWCEQGLMQADGWGLECQIQATKCKYTVYITKQVHLSKNTDRVLDNMDKTLVLPSFNGDALHTSFWKHGIATGLLWKGEGVYQ